MRHPLFKLGLFLALWYECAVELHLGGIAAFVMALLVRSGFGMMLWLPRQVIGLLGPRTVMILLQAALWVGLFWALAPAKLQAQPGWIHISGLVLLVLAGAKARELFERHRLARLADESSDYSLPIILMVLGGSAASVLSFTVWGGLWPFIGYLLLPGLPLRLGWQLMPPGSPERVDARFGNASAFRKAGVSDDF